ncbi:hypothetical protein FQN60_006017 [Etheostoma spectabile]|uniref:SLC26A/SulP transporter domain-containing protein n=1 Tax=Etheostoma spectabile TaxID=54343 RepID=A0A5J5CA32_9PERO|nr:hypothetical protein FQN60_006017 [Etheostoma spectabile]
MSPSPVLRRSSLCYAGCCAPGLWSVLVVLPRPALHLLRTSRHISIGTFAVISLMIGSVAVREAPDSMFYVPPANGSKRVRRPGRGGSGRQEGAGGRCAHNPGGSHPVCARSPQVWFRAIYLTEPLVRGFTTAASVHVVISQLKYLLGVRTQRFSGPLSAIYSVKAVLCDITSTNVSTLILGLACFVFLFAIKDLNERFKKRLPIPIPGEIIVVIVSTGVSYGMSLSEDYKVDVVGKIPTGLLPPTAPEFSLLPGLVADSFAVAVVGFSMGISLAKTFALKHGYSVDGNQELIALGLCNSSALSSKPSPSRAPCRGVWCRRALVEKTQIAGLLGSLLVCWWWWPLVSSSSRSLRRRWPPSSWSTCWGCSSSSETFPRCGGTAGSSWPSGSWPSQRLCCWDWTTASWRPSRSPS